jgi:hypothetical protein
MHKQYQDTRQSRLLALALVTLIGVLAVPSAFGFGAARGLILAFIDPTAALSVDGRRLIITGTGPCTPQEGQAQFTVSVLQASTLASVRSAPTVPQACRPDLTWTIPLTVPATGPNPKPAFIAGPAQVCALAKSRNATGLTDVDQWCAFTTLVVDPGL